MIFVSPEYWKSELTRPREEIKKTLNYLENLNSKDMPQSMPSLQNNVSFKSMSIAKRKPRRKIHNNNVSSDPTTNMFTSSENSMQKVTLSGANISHKITIDNNGNNDIFSTLPGKTILEAAHISDVDLPSSCTMGGCGSCQVHLVSGEVHMSGPHCLSQEEIDDGEILACRATALSNIKIEIHDIIK
jgi:ferredoxin